ncbi:hypothetical protein N7481_000276 [Penicillium waksmanii]|uniref:uncharacterized protein n=1 Tax=Penicillium waksmanii TaxID=69791 RepID=UPI002549ACAF|nr:uncharacterized protein N7481_000276 [Penicillium waksmanii]KAJ5999867.1 hypothetical protein N7481_000276 [Penicillium waksmanii]
MAPRSFKALVIAVSGTFPGYKQADLKALITDQGASFSTSVSAECTHLVTNEKDVEKNSNKYQAACNSDKCHIVSLDWLLESVNSKKPLTEKKYALGQKASSKPALDDTKKNGKAKNGDSAKAAAGKTKAVKKEPEEVNGDAIKTTGKKRAIKQEDDEVDDSSKKQKDSQKVGFKSLNVPVELGAINALPYKGIGSNTTVLIDDSGVIWDATLNQTNSTNNNNKFYRIQVILTDTGKSIAHYTWSRWGRVGENGQSSLIISPTLKDALSLFEKKFKDKSGLKWEDRLDTPKDGKYTFIEKNYEEEDDEPKAKNGKAKKEPSKDSPPPVESKLAQPLQNLMSFIFNQDHITNALRAMDYDAEKLPLGKLSERTLKSGFSILKELSELMLDPTDISRQSLMSSAAIAPPILSTGPQIKKEVELIEALTDMDVANEIMNEAMEMDDVNQLDQQFKGLGLKEMTQLDHKSEEFTELSNYLKNSSGATHYINYEVIDIFRIERDGEEDRFTSSEYAKLKSQNRRLLWHGSRSTNFGGILSQGLRIAPPEAPVNGYMFGKGVYLADTSTKSANYCCSYNSAGMGLLLLCDAELGEPMHELYHSDYQAGERAKEVGKIATLGQGRTIPGGWKDAGSFNKELGGVQIPDVSCALGNDVKASLQYNEYIVYDVAQIRQRYLFYVKM